MNTYQIYNKKNGKVVAVVKADSRYEALQQVANPEKYNAGLANADRM